ncbi:hypothetical protein [Synechococcus sp. GFB01]|uniref:hypothetical protein n=1 Tax=Synechococcus sp. GFB01 TaxID=1662190 RepID=UPI00128E5F77|nr:hypothetical protein [Synechococcus sp. GFB01]
MNLPEHVSHNNDSDATRVLSGQCHSVGALELRRLALEGAIVVVEEWATPVSAQLRNTLQLTPSDTSMSINNMIPDQETPLICLAEGWMPAQDLGNRLCQAGYQYVFTAATCWGGLLAIQAATSLGKPSTSL